MNWLIKTEGNNGTNIFYTKDDADLMYALELLGKYDLTGIYKVEFTSDQETSPAE